jgi:4,5-dihydroxyphthalate decarboxylase
VRVEPIPAERTLSEMLETGEIDALYSPETPGPFRAGSAHVRRLFADVSAVEEAYLRDTGIFPIMHTVVLRRDVYERERWIARSLQKAFEDALDLALQDLRETIALKVALPWLQTHLERTAAVFGTQQFWTYGVGPNREVLRTFLRYAHSQGLIPRILEPEELFAPETAGDPSLRKPA